MIESYHSHNRDDFRQRYRYSYGWMINPENGKKTLAYISNVDGYKVTFSTMDGDGFYVNCNSGIDFEFLPVTRGWYYTTKHGWMMLSRIPAKQYNRGIHQSNTHCQIFETSKSLYSIRPNLSILNDVFVAKPTPTDGSIKLNNCFLLTKDFLWFYDCIVGKREGNTIKLSFPMVGQEVSDCVRRNALQLEVVYG